MSCEIDCITPACNNAGFDLILKTCVTDNLPTDPLGPPGSSIEERMNKPVWTECEWGPAVWVRYGIDTIWVILLLILIIWCCKKHKTMHKLSRTTQAPLPIHHKSDNEEQNAI